MVSELSVDTESNGDGEPAAKRPKHEASNGETAEERSRDQTSPENRAKVEPKKEVSLCKFF